MISLLLSILTLSLSYVMFSVTLCSDESILQKIKEHFHKPLIFVLQANVTNAA
jgi:hypothetical protein